MYIFNFYSTKILKHCIKKVLFYNLIYYTTLSSFYTNLWFKITTANQLPILFRVFALFCSQPIHMDLTLSAHLTQASVQSSFLVRRTLKQRDDIAMHEEHEGSLLSWSTYSSTRQHGLQRTSFAGSVACS